MTELLLSISHLNKLLKPTFASQLVDKIKKTILTRVKSLDKKEVNAIGNWMITYTLDTLKDFMEVSMSKSEADAALPKPYPHEDEDQSKVPILK